MDQLAQRYADPSFMLGGFIRTRRLAQFVHRFTKIVNEEHKEQATWEVYLHKVFEKSYSDFKNELAEQEKLKGLTPNDLKATVQESEKILLNFEPERR